MFAKNHNWHSVRFHVKQKLVRRTNDDPSIVLFTLACGADGCVFLEKQVYNASFPSGHRWKTDGAPLSDRPACSTVRHTLNSLSPALPVTFRVDHNLFDEGMVFIDNHVE